MQVVHRHHVFHGVVTQFIGRAIGHPTLDPPTGKPDRVTLDVMVPSVPLGHRRPPKLAGQHHQRVLEHVALLEVHQQGPGALVHQLARLDTGCLDPPVMVPAAVIELDKPDAPLHQSAGEQAVCRERPVGSLGAVKVHRLLVFPGQVEQPRNTRLHPECQFILADPRGNFRIPDNTVANTVELLDCFHHVLLLPGSHSRRILDIQDGIPLAVERDSLEAARQKPAMPLPRGNRLVLAPTDRGHDHEAGQVVRLTSQPVLQPGSHRRPTTDRGTGVHEGVSRVMVNRLGLE